MIARPLPLDLAVRGGTVVTARGRARLDVYAAQGQIVALRPANAPGMDAHEVVDATGLFVLPGMVDTHVHLMDPGDAEREDFPTGSGAAALQGVTTIVEHTHGWPVTTVDRLDEKLSHLRNRSHIDFGLAAHVWPEHLDQLPRLWASGVAFFKIFTCDTHGVPALGPDLLLDAFDRIAAADGACLVHCEDDDMTAAAEARLRASGRTDGWIVPEWRSRAAEEVAVGVVALLSRLTGARVTVAHASTPDVLEAVAHQAQLGAPIVAETCPQYLMLREEEVATLGPFRKFTPPARLRSHDEEARMWGAFNSGAVNHLSTDHAPATRDHKASHSIWDAHFGLPGLDSTTPLMIDAALCGQTSLERVVAAYATAPARWYRLKGKGEIAVGLAADLALVDPGARWTLEDAGVRSKAGWTPYAGRQVQGRVAATVLRGRVVAREGRLLAPEPSGRFVPGPGLDPSATVPVPGPAG
ncbi:MAG: dihydroorotase [Acidimicrobiales bacterium]